MIKFTKVSLIVVFIAYILLGTILIINFGTPGILFGLLLYALGIKTIFEIKKVHQIDVQFQKGLITENQAIKLIKEI
jgi:hypothetical protein